MKGERMEGSRRTVLLVDDDDAVRSAYLRVLTNAGFDVRAAADGESALQQLRNESFDAVVSDISMPGMDGVQLLREVRQHDRDLPVLLMTGRPSLETATQAIDHGVMKYLSKPVGADELTDAVRRATQLQQLGRAKREALRALGTMTGEGSDRAGLEASFERALESLWVAFQPIVSAADRQVFGYEALLRTEERTLPHPGAVIDAAERLGQLPRLGRVVRQRAAEAFAASDPTWLLFLNLHPEDLLDETLLDAGGPLSTLAGRIVLEITERMSLDSVPDARARVARLRSFGYRIAVDDLGAGYAGLASFVQMEPDFVKLDMSLIRDVHKSSLKRRLVRSMTSLCQEMGLGVVAEGVEIPEERDALVDLGLDLLQGYHFARPAQPFAQPTW
ncbi:MAG: EAL domain-containing response regulator [Myxococcales bacterium]|nr:EAL domain-containing response regulator [Myxococcales bacterium]